MEMPVHDRPTLRSLALGLTFIVGMPAWAQFQDLATTDDGSQLYFSSMLRLKGTDQFNNGKIFQYSNGTFKLIAQTAPTVTLPDQSMFQFAFGMPSVSGNGAVLTYDGTASCTGGRSCLGSLTSRGFVTGEQLPPTMTSYGSLRISDNGRYTLRFGGMPSGILPEAPELFDAQTGQLSLLESATIIGDGRQSVADDGTVLTNQGLWKNGQFTRLTFAQFPVVARLSSNGATVVYESSSGGCSMAGPAVYCSHTNFLYAHSVASGVDTQLEEQGPFAPGRPGINFLPSVSNDGSKVLYGGPALTGPYPGWQAILSNTDGTGRRVLTSEANGIGETLLSGDGRLAYAVTFGGGLLVIDTSSGQVQRLLPDAPLIYDTRGPLVPGSLATLLVQALAASGSQISIGGLTRPVVESTANSVTVQVPWETSLIGPVTVISTTEDSPFEQVVAFQPVAIAPLFASVLHMNFRGPPTEADPAHPGEILAAFMTGLGPVAPPVSTDQPASLSVLSTTQNQSTCQWQVYDTTTSQMQLLPGRIFFSGLAPGSIGVYQVNVGVPANIAAPYPAELDCTWTLPFGGQASAKATIWVAGP